MACSFFPPLGNVMTTENSAIASVKRIATLCGCMVEEIVNVEKKKIIFIGV